MRVLSLLAALLLLMLSGCDRSPEADAIKGDLSGRLSEGFADAFEIIAFSRRGCTKDIAAPEGETRRIVYFDVLLRARKDLDLGSWDTPGAASLVSMLGAGPKGVAGVKSEGNKSGDEIRAHGSAVYRWEGGSWKIVAAAGFVPPEAPVTDNQAARPASEKLISTLQSAIRSLPPGMSPSDNAIVQDELQRAINNIQARMAHVQEGIALAAGPEQGQYLSFARALMTSRGDRRPRVTPLITAGSVENLKLLQEGAVLFALTQGDVAALALSGAEPFAGQGAASELRAIGSLYIEPLHVIVMNDAPVRTIADLASRRVNVGPTGSGTRITALKALAAHGLPEVRIGQVSGLGLAPALAALRDGRVDAVMEVIGLPSNEIRNAFATLRLRLVPLDSTVIDRLVRDDASYVATLVPPGAYPRHEGSVPTVGVAAILATTAQLTPAEANIAARLVYTTGDLMKNGSAQGAQVSARTARLGLTIPMHEGAERALAELGPR
jgi:TRAP transporter TAXI family solute receptor